MVELITPVDLGFVTVIGGGIAPYSRLRISNETRSSVICSTVLEGSVATEGATATAGQVMIHPANRPFSEVSDRAGVHEWIAFRFDVFHPIWSTLKMGSVGTLNDPAQTTAAFCRLRSALCEFSVSHQAEALFAFLNQIEPSVRPDTFGRANRFDHILRYIDQNLHLDLSRSVLADLAGMHPNAFDRAFRIDTGLSSQEFVRSIRISRAKRKVCDASQTLDAVAFSLGLSSAAYFSRWFKFETGQSPTEYREGVNKTRTGYFETYFSE